MRRLRRALAPLLVVLATGCDFFELPALGGKPFIVVTPTSGLSTSEAGGTASFTVQLASPPTADVTIALASSRTEEGRPAPASLTFTPETWNAPQTVTVGGVDDDVSDGDQRYDIVTAPAVSADPAYAGLDPPDVSVTNVDDEAAGVLVDPTSGLTTAESGTTAAFTIRLRSRPTSNVSLALSSSRPSEGTVSPSTVTFDPANWNTPQTVTVTGVNDSVVDGNQRYVVVIAPAVSSDPGYAGVDPPDVSLTNVDDDTAGVTVAPVSGLTTTEAGGAATFTIQLNAQPTANVTIGLASSDPSEGTVSPTSFTFTPSNWNTPQTATVTGVDDPVADGNQSYAIVTAPAASTDAAYAGLDPPDVSVTNSDNDTPGITVSPTSGLTTTEAGGVARFTIKLDTQPTANVTVGLTSSDSSEGTVSASALTFTPANWSTPQTVTVTGVDDPAADGNQTYAIVTAPATSTDAAYAGLDPPDVSVTNSDNDTVGVTVTPVSGLTTTEAGGAATFTIQLNTQPTANVTIGLTSSDPGEGTVTPASFTFTPASWSAPQTATVTGVNDLAADGNQTYAIVTAPAASTDAAYAGLDPPDVSLTNLDDDTAGFTVTPTSGLVTTEAGGTGTFTIQLATPPTANVTIALASSDPGEGTVSPASVSFTPANWNVAQTVTVTGVPDAIPDGAQPYTIVLSPAVSADPGYAGRDPPDVSVTNGDVPPL
jgi:hypothetical protein